MVNRSLRATPCAVLPPGFACTSACPCAFASIFATCSGMYSIFLASNMLCNAQYTRCASRVNLGELQNVFRLQKAHRPLRRPKTRSTSLPQLIIALLYFPLGEFSWGAGVRAIINCRREVERVDRKSVV